MSTSELQTEHEGKWLTNGLPFYSLNQDVVFGSVAVADSLHLGRRADERREEADRGAATAGGASPAPGPQGTPSRARDVAGAGGVDLATLSEGVPGRSRRALCGQPSHLPANPLLSAERSSAS